MNSSYLQFVFAMVLVINGIMCQIDQAMLQCEYRGNDGRRNFTVAADAKKVLKKVLLDVNANITCGASDTWRGEEWLSFEIVCPVEWRILLRVSPMDIDKGIIVKAFDDEEEHSMSSRTRLSNYPIFLLSASNLFEIHATYSDNTMQNKRFMLGAWTVKVIEQIDPDSSCQVNQTTSIMDSPKSNGTCEGRCGAFNASKSCQCNPACKGHKDCCHDYLVICDPASTCEGRCGESFEPDLSCQCNDECQEHADCCEDYMDKCLIEDPASTCEGRCGEGFEPDLYCQCNDECQEHGDCCEDYMDKCLIEGNGNRTLGIECPTNSSYDDVLISFGYEIAGEMTNGYGYLTVICTRFEERFFDVGVRPAPRLGLRISCTRMPNTLMVIVTSHSGQHR